jgi:hypothetical protein
MTLKIKCAQARKKRQEEVEKIRMEEQQRKQQVMRDFYFDTSNNKYIVATINAMELKYLCCYRNES